MLLIKQEMWNVEAHGRIKDTRQSATSFCTELLCFRSKSRDGEWVLRTLRPHYTVMQFPIFQKFKRWTGYLIKTHKSIAHYSWALQTAASRMHQMSISKQRAIILRKTGRGYFNGKVIENIRNRKQQKQASCLRLPTHTEFCVTASSSWKKPAGSLQSYLHIQPHGLNWFFCSVSSKLICLAVSFRGYFILHHHPSSLSLS